MEITHGGDIYSFGNAEILDFSSNINPLGLATGVREAILNNVDKCINYPDPLCRQLKISIADWEGVFTDQVVCGNGAADLIYRIVQAIRPKKALLIAPTFSEYECALKAAGCDCTFYLLSEDQGFAINEAFLDSLHEGLDMVFVCNPNNPTGLVIQPDLMRGILGKCRELNITLLVDECFNDFLDDPDKHTMKNYLDKYPNLFILKAFTKLFAIPGLRLGYGLSGNARMIDIVSRQGQVWGVSVLAQAAGAAAVCEKGYLQRTREIIKTERSFLKKALAAIECTVYDSKANYVFFKAQRTSLYEYLKKRRILIRQCSNFRGLTPEFYRIAVRLHEQNVLLVNAMGEFFKTEENRF